MTTESTAKEATNAGGGIDREALVRRHNPRVEAPDALSPLTVGNGEFAFTSDVTGMQSFPGFHQLGAAGGDATPLGTQAQWGFHEMPNPEGWSLSDVMRPYASAHGPVDYPVEYDFTVPPALMAEEQLPGYWLWVNPQRLDLGRLGLELRRSQGDAIETDVASLDEVDQQLDLWTGVLRSRFRHGGNRYSVTTVAHPDSDAVAVRIESEALADGSTTVGIRFPYASDTFGDTVDWEHPARHLTELASGDGWAKFTRTLDETEYFARLRWNERARIDEVDDHHYRVTASASTLELVLAFSSSDDGDAVPSYDEVEAASSAHWRTFWERGAAVDLSESRDPRAFELERRIVLSQFITATQAAGRYPSQETGLVHNSWAGKFHLEMHWWHAAHFAMWGRPDLLERSFSWYLDALPVAQDIARRQGYEGARWPKHVGPAGRESPNDIGPLLIWQQPHPIHFAELLRRARPDGQALERYGEIVDETARFIASFLHRREDGRYHLVPPIMPAQESYDPSTVVDPPFELAYFWWGLDVARRWRQLRELPPMPEWDTILDSMAAPAVADGVYTAVAEPPHTIVHDHPSLLGALGVVPKTPIIDEALMSATLHDVVSGWAWESGWGWDFPMLAMCATRLAEPGVAVDALMMQTPRNRYLPNGQNCQDPSRLPLYLPGNGGLLAAVALMAGGWDGSTGDAPGFPTDGSWIVRHEGFGDRP